MENPTKEKNFSFSYIPGLLLIMVILHFFANATGIYQKQINNNFVWFDNVLHAIAGVAFALLFLWILNKNNTKHTLIKKIFLTIGFVFCLAVLWELVEFGLFKFFTQQAQNLNIYSPSIKEACSDIMSNIAGATLLLLVKRK